MAIDYGKKRTGIAVTDPLQIIATGLTTVETHMALVFLRDYLSREQVETIIVGEPLNLDDTETHATAGAREFAKKLKRHFPQVKVEMVDERFTSKMASDAIREMGLKKKDRREKGIVDTVAAAIMLKEYLESRNPGIQEPR
jgi:putative Holliday junction resolvase